MPISLSEYIKIDESEFKKTGAFDAILDVDSKLFIDPHLLQATKVPELAKSYERITKLFEELLLILSKSKEEGDIFWRTALRKFYFPELKGLCIGYSSKGTAGSGMGPSLRIQILRTAKSIVDAGLQEPELFELIGLFEENVGPDRISDMVGRIIVSDLQQYTQRVFEELKTPTISIQNTPYRSIYNPFNGQPLILLPKEILNDLPIAECWEEIDVICRHNAALRLRINEVIGETWKKATTSVRKSKLREVLVEEPEILDDLINLYRKKPAKIYDFESDPAGQVIWYKVSRQYASNYPLVLELPNEPTVEDVLKTVLTICEKFKDLVENNALSSLLYDSSKKPKREEAAQKVFYGIADSYCSANDIDLSSEANGGRGPVDFKMSRGYKGRVVVEAKLTTNPQLLHGFDTQIEEYKKAEKTHFGVYVVIDVLGGSPTRLAALKKMILDSKAAGLRIPEVIFVDAIPKESASKYQKDDDTEIVDETINLN